MQTATSLIHTLFANQQRWLARLATGEPEPAPDHPRLFHDTTVMAARTGKSGVICLQHDDAATLTHVLAALEWLRQHESGDVLIWSAMERPALDRSLLAHGASPGFQPWWMALPLDAALPEATASVTIDQATGPDIHDLFATKDIPYLNHDLEPATRALVEDSTATRLLVARDATTIVGQAILNLAGDFAGLYNLAVHPAARNHGTGTALTIAVCNLASEMGARHIGLNATPQGAGMYERVGFNHLGKGQTWMWPGQRLRHPASPADIDIAMKLAHGTVVGIDPKAIPALMPNGERPIAFAARSGSPETARWLLEAGVDPEILPLWQLGLRDDALAAMRTPRLREQTAPPMHGTALHLAIQAGDADLVRHLIDANADLSAQDAQFRSTPLGWAEALGQPEIAEMIREAGGR